MTDRMTDEWVKQLYWDGSEEELWQKYKSDFVRRPEADRLNELHRVNAWLGEEDRPTREAASLLTKARELKALHKRLKGINR